MDHNPALKPWQTSAPNNIAGQGQIEVPGQVTNLVWQNRAAPPSAYENALADALERVFEAGALTPQDVVTGLNAQGVRTPEGRPWDTDAFEREMARLGA
jgi:hypothetical protein